ncbi:MAG TPA: hypothetical protein VG753_00475 [Candidatus Paceibacterota bacterium]|nr:hypothetical protein [Candidatus Paceibacterota bacterium]
MPHQRIPLDTFLSDIRLRLPERWVEAFRKQNIIILEDLLKIPEAEILRIPRIRRADVGSLREILEEAGYNIGELAPKRPDKPES